MTFILGKKTSITTAPEPAKDLFSQFSAEELAKKKLLAEFLSQHAENARFSKKTRLITDPFDFIQFIPLPFIDFLNAVKAYLAENYPEILAQVQPVFDGLMNGLFFASASASILSGLTTTYNSVNKIIELHKELNEIKLGTNLAKEKDELDQIIEELSALNQHELSADDKKRIRFLEKRLRRITLSTDDRIASIETDIENHKWKLLVNGLFMIAPSSLTIGLVGAKILAVSPAVVILSAFQTISATAVACMYYRKWKMAEERLDNFNKNYGTNITEEKATIDASDLTDKQKIAKKEKIDLKYTYTRTALENHVKLRQQKFEKYSTLAITSAVVLTVSIIGLVTALPPLLVIVIALTAAALISYTLADYYKYNLDRKEDIKSTQKWVNDVSNAPEPLPAYTQYELNQPPPPYTDQPAYTAPLCSIR